MSIASSPKATAASEQSPSKAQTPTTTVDFDTPRVEELFEAPLHEFNIHPQEASMLASETDNLLICTACGTQFDVESRTLLTRCRICDDPRQFVPRTGQSFTTMGELRQGPYKNKWKRFDEDEDRFWMIYTEPQFAIGQRAILIKTPQGNILWDCIAFLDGETVDWINDQGGLAAIVISHPHYYTSHLEWAEAFECPIYLAWEDKGWLNRLDRMGKARTFIESTEEEIEVRGEKTGVVILKPGGHFPGSLVCLAYERLLLADTIVTTPSGKGDWSLGPGGGDDARPGGMNTYAFMWSIPNMIPLSPDEIMGVWNVIKKHEFTRTHGAFFDMEVQDGGNGSKTSVKQRMLESMQIQVRASGWKEHALFKEISD